jgi:hypothetical protein
MKNLKLSPLGSLMICMVISVGGYLLVMSRAERNTGLEFEWKWYWAGGLLLANILGYFLGKQIWSQTKEPK